MLFATVFCWTAWTLVIIYIDPFQASRVDFFFFYLSLFLSLLGTLSLICFGLLFFLRRTDAALYRYVKKSFAYAAIISLIVIVLYYLQSEGYLHYWNVATLGTLALFLILFRLSTRPRLRARE